MKNKVLVTGGCGYIGSHTLVDLIDNGYDVICADSLINADSSALKGVEKITGKNVKNYAIDLCDADAVHKVFAENRDIIGVIHFAALKSVGESVEKPLAYYRNNLQSLVNVLAYMSEFDVRNFIFSSSCSVYGNSRVLPVTENTPLEPAESPYARTKQIGEDIICDFSLAHPFITNIALRYFNPAGAHESGIIGESSRNIASNLVPVITETAIGKRKEVVVFGDDYPTRDGSCIRDYIHVCDIAHAHTLALEYAVRRENATNFEVFNLGTGDGVSVLEAIKAFETENKLQFRYRIGQRRPGDVISIYANNDKAKNALGWIPKYNINDIMRTAWAWEKNRSQVLV